MEKAAYEKDKLAKVPPNQLAENHQRVTPGMDLMPGMPIKVGYYGDWVDGEVISLRNDGWVAVKLAPTRRIQYFAREKWLAIHPDVLARAHSDPDAYTPSVRVLPGTTRTLPSRAIPIDPDWDLPRGAPLLSYFGEWKRVIVMEDRGDSIVVHHPGRPTMADRPEQRAELAILKSTVERLQQPDAAEHLAANLKEVEKDRAGSSRPGRLGGDRSDEFNDEVDDFLVVDRNYPIRISLPRRAVKVPTGLELPKDTLVAYCWGRKWQAATVVRDDGQQLLVQEDSRAGGIILRVEREQLIIQSKTLSKIRRSSSKAVKDLATTLRTWTDSTGQHKVEARFVSVTDGKVILKTDKGREIKLPLDRLSEDDRDLLRNAIAISDNPFK